MCIVHYYSTTSHNYNQNEREKSLTSLQNCTIFLHLSLAADSSTFLNCSISSDSCLEPMLVVLPGRLSNRVGIGVFILASFKLESHISHVLRPGPFSYVHTLHLNHLGSFRCCSQARHWLDLRGFLRVHLEQAQYSPFLRVPFSRDFSLEPPHAWHMDTCPGFSRVHLLHIQSLLSASTSSFESSTWNIEKKRWKKWSNHVFDDKWQ